MSGLLTISWLIRAAARMGDSAAWVNSYAWYNSIPKLHEILLPKNNTIVAEDKRHSPVYRADAGTLWSYG
ncbi:hypothetical protein [Amaricoccus sp. W119]|uniref:hypothetical protein n=1 Tax=Amaricoccus sp. W119 TaxID=3391833 RepID=UPI0039A4C7A5